MREQGAAGVSPVSVHESVTSRDEHYIAAVVTETIVEGTDKSLIWQVGTERRRCEFSQVELCMR